MERRCKCFLMWNLRQMIVPRLSVMDVTVNPPINNADATGRYCNFQKNPDKHGVAEYILWLAIYFWLDWLI